MPEDLFTFTDKPEASYLLAGWRRQWSNGGRISSGLPRYLIEKNGGRQVGQFSEYVNRMCYPFQVAGTHDAFRPLGRVQRRFAQRRHVAAELLLRNR